MKWAALTKPITRAGLFMVVSSDFTVVWAEFSGGRIPRQPRIGYRVSPLRDVANEYRRNANRSHRGHPAPGRRWRAPGGAALSKRRPARHPHAPRGATGLCRARHHAGHDAERALAGATRPRGVGAGLPRT